MEASNGNGFGSFGSGGDNPGVNSNVSPMVGTPAVGATAGGVPVGGVSGDGMPGGMPGDGMPGGMPGDGMPGGGMPMSGGMLMNGGVNGGVPMNGEMNPVAYNNGMLANNAVTMDADTGDIVIGGTGKSKKKWWVIGGCAVGLVVICLFVLVGSMVNNSFVGDSRNLETVFDDYLMLFVYGDSIVDGPSNIDRLSTIDVLSKSSKDCAFVVALNNTSIEKVDRYYEDLMGEMNLLGRYIEGEKGEYADSLKADFDTHKNNVELYRMSRELLNSNQMLSLYVSNQYDELQRDFDTMIDQDEDFTLRLFGIRMSKYLNDQVSLYDSLRAAGCFDGSIIDNECEVNYMNANMDTIYNNDRDYANLSSTADSILRRAISPLVEMNGFIYGENNEQTN